MTDLIIRQFETLQPYTKVWELMRSFTLGRSKETTDEIWMLEHSPVFTQGLAGKAEHLLNPHKIPVIQTDRGGQITYHGPGQLMAYLLLDIKRRKLSTRSFVRTIEALIVDYLNSFSIKANGNPAAPGIYVNNTKICSIGLRIRRGCYSYHGFALNVNMDLSPFSFINPCGFKGLAMTQMKNYVPNITLVDLKKNIIPYFLNYFGYNQPKIIDAEKVENTPHEQQNSL